MADDETTEFETCLTCGALVGDKALHVKWHNRPTTEQRIATMLR